MTTISAEVVADSISPGRARLLTMQLRYPRWIHSEIMTHKALSKNASSGRAIPLKTMNKSIIADPAFPLHIGKHQPGMQAHTQITDHRHRNAVVSLWRDVMKTALRASEDMANLFDVAKQVYNRPSEPFSHISVLISGTDWENFFALRCHPMAEPHFRCLAWQMADLYYKDSKPTELRVGDWHLPYVKCDEYMKHDIEDLKKFSTARCARVSYNNHDGSDPDPEKDLKLYDRLMAGLMGDDPLEPGHLSPAEHVARALEDPNERSGPFRGWKQHRKEFAKENMTFDYEAAVARGWRAEALSILGLGEEQ